MNLAAAIVAFISPAAGAHPPFSSVIEVVITPERKVTCTVVHDGLALALNQPSSLLRDIDIRAVLDATDNRLAHALTIGQNHLQQVLEFKVDGKRALTTIVAASTEADIRAWQQEQAIKPSACTMAVIFDVPIDPTSSRLSIRPPEVLGDTLIALDIPGAERFVIPVNAGEQSPDFDITVDGSLQSQPVQAVNGANSTLNIAWRYLVIGFHHIVPEGTDHELFVLGLFLLTPRIRPLLWQITAFTLAHTTTLTLGAFGLISVNPLVIEPIIAFSIAFIAIENIYSKKLHAWRLVVVFIFGLVHGLGFAQGLMDVGLPNGQLATGLIGFSAGVEAGQCAVIILAFAMIGWCRNKPWYRSRIVIPTSLLITAMAMWWGITRMA